MFGTTFKTSSYRSRLPIEAPALPSAVVPEYVVVMERSVVPGDNSWAEGGFCPESRRG